MQIGTILQSVQRHDRASGYCLGKRQTGEMQLAVDQHAACAAPPLAAAEFGCHVADQLAQSDEQIGAAIDKNRDVAAVVTKLQSSLGHDAPIPERTTDASDGRRRSRVDTR